MSVVRASQLFNPSGKYNFPVQLQCFLRQSTLRTDKYYTLVELNAVYNNNLREQKAKKAKVFRIFDQRNAALQKYIFLMNGVLMQNISPQNYHTPHQSIEKIMIDKFHIAHGKHGMLLSVSFNPSLEKNLLQHYDVNGLLYTKDMAGSVLDEPLSLNKHDTTSFYLELRSRILYTEYISMK